MGPMNSFVKIVGPRPSLFKNDPQPIDERANEEIAFQEAKGYRLLSAQPYGAYHLQILLTFVRDPAEAA